MKTLVFLAVVVSFFAEVALAKDGRLRCRATGAAGREAELRFEDGELRAKWEIDADAGQELGDLVAVVISGQPVGNIVLNELEDDELEGELEIFEGLPAIRSGTKAQVGSLKCTFRK